MLVKIALYYGQPSWKHVTGSLGTAIRSAREWIDLYNLFFSPLYSVSASKEKKTGFFLDNRQKWPRVPNCRCNFLKLFQQIAGNHSNCRYPPLRSDYFCDNSWENRRWKEETVLFGFKNHLVICTINLILVAGVGPSGRGV